MKTYYYEKKTAKEQSLFLSLCCQEDQQKLTQEIPMTFRDFLRITCILFYMNLTFYEIKLNELFPEFYFKKEQLLARLLDITEEYPSFSRDENFEEVIRQWLTDFYNQIPDKRKKASYRKMLLH